MAGKAADDLESDVECGHCRLSSDCDGIQCVCHLGQ